MIFDRVNCNISLEKLFALSEVGYLEEIVDGMQDTSLLETFKLYIYFKTTWSKWDLDENLLDTYTILFLVVDEGGFVPDHLSKKVHIIFKHYLRTDKPEKNIYHLPVGPNSKLKFDQKIIPIKERGLGVFFSGNLHVGRANLYRRLSGVNLLPFCILHRCRNIFGNDYSNYFPNSYVSFTHKFHTGLAPDKYSIMLQNSKIVLCPPGNPGLETMRHYEAMKAGCIIISESLPKVNSFINSPIITVRDWREVDSLIKGFLDNENLLKEKQNEIINWWMNKCNSFSVVSYLIDTITTKGIS